MVKAEDLSCSSKEIVDVQCDVCGKIYSCEFIQYYQRHKCGDALDRCKSCAAILGYEKSKTDRASTCFDRLRSVCDKYGYKLLTQQSEFTNDRMVVQYVCPKHGVQTALLSSLERGHGCLRCSYEERADKCRYTADEVEEIINSVNDNVLLNKSDYTGVKDNNLRVLCGKCKCNVFTTSLDKYMNKTFAMCEDCVPNESSGEIAISEYLKSNDIEFVPQKKYPDCKDKRPLPFDFYLPTYNLIIEFDGQQHFEPVWGEEHFKYIERHDKMKNEYCMNNNIHMLRISYLQGHNIGELITNKLNEIMQVKDIV